MRTVPAAEGGPSQFERHCTLLEGVVVLERRPVADERGDFARLYCDIQSRSDEQTALPAAQVNISRNPHVGTVRGMHLLLPPAEEFKIVTCVQGAIWDVAVDLRPGSSTLFQSFGVELRGDSNVSLVIPPGCAHGFQVLQTDSSVLYINSERYSSNLDAGVRADDPELAISWPLPIGIRSERDSALPTAAALMATRIRVT